MTSDTPRGITVAVDGTAVSQSALRWALEHAAQSKQLVTVLACATEGADVAAVRRATREQVTTALTEVSSTLSYGMLAVRVARGDPRTALVGVSATSQLLVLGAPSNDANENERQDGVVRHCVARAACGVVIVPAAVSRRHGLARHLGAHPTVE